MPEKGHIPYHRPRFYDMFQQDEQVTAGGSLGREWPLPLNAFGGGRISARIDRSEAVWKRKGRDACFSAADFAGAVPATVSRSAAVARMFDHLYIFAMLFFSVYSQIIIRWQVGLAGGLPDTLEGKFFFVLRLLFSPWMITAMAATFFSGISWMMAMTKFEISYAYPWVGLNFVLMLAVGVFLFGENFSLMKGIGTLLIIAGIAVIGKS